MVQVYNVLIQCPVTRRPIKTGVQTASPQSFAQEIYEGLFAECPHCKEEHRWKKEDAFLVVEDSWCESDALWRPNR